MAPVWLHLRAALLEIARTPAFLVPTAVFPSMLFLFFGLPSARTPQAAAFILTSFAVFGVMGVCFYQFGVGIAEDRAGPWEDYLRTLPVTAAQRFAARLLAALAVTAVTLLLLGVTAVATTPARLSVARWLLLVAALLVGGVPFGLFGIALGYSVPARAAVPIANLIYLPLSFLGGIWLPPDQLPGVVAWISPLLPSRIAGELAWAAALGRSLAPAWLAGLAAYTLVGYLACLWAYRRSEQAYG
ncbi:MAG: ABC transporter permease [Candidatus Rokubacteria bacterium]|nr:ABC transporter permease [Candidatus Rokubacteria bacterium]